MTPLKFHRMMPCGSYDIWGRGSTYFHSLIILAGQNISIFYIVLPWGFVWSWPDLDLFLDLPRWKSKQSMRSKPIIPQNVWLQHLLQLPAFGLATRFYLLWKLPIELLAGICWAIAGIRMRCQNLCLPQGGPRKLWHWIGCKYMEIHWISKEVRSQTWTTSYAWYMWIIIHQHTSSYSQQFDDSTSAKFHPNLRLSEFNGWYIDTCHSSENSVET